MPGSFGVSRGGPRLVEMSEFQSSSISSPQQREPMAPYSPPESFLPTPSVQSVPSVPSAPSALSVPSAPSVPSISRQSSPPLSPHSSPPSISSPPTSRDSRSRPPSSSSAAAESDVGMVATQLNHVLGGTSATSLFQTSEMREELFRDCLEASDIDIDELRRIVWAHGVPDRPWARSITWKLLTGYLPADRAEWDSVLGARRAEYWETITKLTIDPSLSSAVDDHPLNVDAGSRWAEYFRDRDLLEVIDRDVVRTHADLHRFAPLRDSLRRILFAYVKSSEGAVNGYRQGMNELASPILLCFVDTPFTDHSDAEADSYFCFNIVMQEMANMYCTREREDTGINRQLREMQALLRIKDPRVDAHLSQLGIDLRFYALRWTRLWLAREFCMPDLLRIWDSLLATEIRLPWLRFICVAMLIRIREDLLVEDFAGCMKLLLNYPACDIAELLGVADRLRTANVTITRTVPRR